MSVRIATVFLNSFLALVPLGLSQNPNQTRQHLSTAQTPAVESSNKSVTKALLRIQLGLKQITEDVNTVNARMFQESGNGSDQTVSMAPRIHALLKNDDPATLIRDFFHSSQDRLRWESCMKSGRLYRNLAAEIFITRRTRTAEIGQATGQPILGDEFVQTAQLVFLSRMIPELELQYGELQALAKTIPDAEREELWHRFRDAMRHDDQLLLGKLSAFLSSAGEFPNQFAVRVLAQAQKTSPSAAASIVESMAILSPAGDLWKLADVPGINPDFLSALECERRVMNSVPAADVQATFLQAFNCRGSADGSSVPAFAGSRTHPAQSIATSSKAPVSGPGEVPQTQGIFRLPTDKELQDLQSQDSKSDTVPAAPGQPPAFGVSNTPVKRPKIPSWWIRCACPDDHPDAGIVFEGIRWHAPVLQCPNPELRSLEVK
ncbi:MAG: hypothetical protein EXQ58_04895 [Acidobacteria bacterium]|nr:hypothetical protein [Acidobacteriota bacterium]